LVVMVEEEEEDGPAVLECPTRPEPSDVGRWPVRMLSELQRNGGKLVEVSWTVRLGGGRMHSR
jgi:hypothetical protein